METQIEILRDKINAEIPDPRRTSYGHILHEFSAILIIAFLANLCGITSFYGMRTFAVTRKRWLSQFINLSNGIPSADTIRRCLRDVNSDALSWCLYGWLSIFLLKCDIISLDGKTIRGSKTDETPAVHILSAFCGEHRVTLAEMTVPDKDNEITAAKQMLNMIDIEGSTITGDAMFCQHELCQIIHDNGGDYCFCVKGNQPHLLEDVQLTLTKGQNIQTATISEKGHGRIETREYSFTTEINGLDRGKPWAGLSGVGSVTRTTYEKGKETVDTRYFITSSSDFAWFQKITREHWGIENGLHWSLDVLYREDYCRVHIGNGPRNLNTLRKGSLVLVERATNLIGKAKVSRNRVMQVCQDSSFALGDLLNGKSLERFF